MKRKIASRKLIRSCFCCNRNFYKGDIYYIDRKVHMFYGELHAYEAIYCGRCKYENEESCKRRNKFIESGKCHHPVVNTIWRTMDGEDYAQEPSHVECLICRKKV